MKPFGVREQRRNTQYGLQLGRRSSRSDSTFASFPRGGAVGEDEDEDEDDISTALARDAAAKQAVAKRQRSAAEADRISAETKIYDYDAAYDELQKDRRQEAARSRGAAGSAPKSRYVEGLLKSAAERKKHSDEVYERRIQREQASEAHLYEDKESFVTSAYKEKLEERRIAEEEEKKGGGEAASASMGTFYYNVLNRNVNLGQNKELDASRSPRAHIINAYDSETQNERSSPKQTRSETRMDSPNRSSSDALAAKACGTTRTSRFSAAVADSTQEGDDRSIALQESRLERIKRLNQRRNSEEDIAKARQRYFERIQHRQQRSRAPDGTASTSNTTVT